MFGDLSLSINIRLEKPCDIQRIHRITIAAFLDEPYADHTEQFIVKALRDAGALTISLVAEDSAQTVGHVAVSPVSISDGSIDWYGLGPISVIPNEQGKGIGQQLINFGIQELKTLGVKLVFTYGDPSFYSKVGFEKIGEEVVKAPKKLTYPEGWLAQSLNNERITSEVGVAKCISALNKQEYW